jgi:hypothetical protein
MKMNLLQANIGDPVNGGIGFGNLFSLPYICACQIISKG